MESPLFWNMPSRSRYCSPMSRGAPVQRRSTASPKVVSIPVQFVRSDRSRDDSAVKIQKVFRGFLVRKCLRKVMDLRKEVCEIERRVSDDRVVDLIRRPGSKEKIKLIESLMSLLFRLDSIRGFDSGVRECRKVTIKKAIALQEAIDAIVAGESMDRAQDPDSDGVSSTNFDSSESSELKNHSPVLDSGEIDEARARSEQNPQSDDVIEPDGAETEEAQLKSPNSSRIVQNPQSEDEIEQTQKLESSTEVKINENSNDSSMEEAESAITIQINDQNPLNNNSMEEESNIQEDSAPEIEETVMETHREPEINEENVSTIQINNQPDQNPNSLNNSMEEGEDSAPRIEETAVENQNLRERDEKIKRNERDVLVGLISELVEKNEKQNKLLSSLSQRVEMLERAFVCDKLRKSKKKRRSC